MTTMRLLRNILLGMTLVLFTGSSLVACSKSKNATETPAPVNDGEKAADDGEATPDGEKKAMDPEKKAMDPEEKAPDGEGSW